MNKLLLIVGVALLAGSIYYLNQEQSQDTPLKIQVTFEEWKQEYGKKYGAAEEQYRYSVFQDNYEKVEAHNADSTQTYQLGLTQFADLTEEEFAAIYLTLKHDEEDNEEYEVFYGDESEEINAVDWSSKVNVKNQGGCGSCWAFSTTGVVEAFYSIKQGKSVNLSEQQLVDCSTANYGCNGGWPSKALAYVKNNGLTTQSAYPYTGRDGKCKTNSGSNKISNVQKVGSTQSALQSALQRYPVSVCVDANKWSLYKSGVFSNCQTRTNHAVTAVGFDGSGNWKIKNSWGTSWGERGFIRLAAGNTCGVLSESYIPA